MEKFLSCDWGTSSFRLRLVETSNLTILKESVSAQGISEIFQSWKDTDNGEEDRLAFYLRIVHFHIRSFEESLGYSLHHVPIALSGMVGSSIGMIELPYKEIPFSVDGSDLIVRILNYVDLPGSNIVIVSGATTGNDVMRGEETQLIGCSGLANERGQTIFIFPGTHSKHVIVEERKTVDFKTYMTGEFFKLLSTKSILSVSVEEGIGITSENNKHSFENGIEESLKSNLLHGSFNVRTNQLFSKFSKSENYYYLSGLLIGTEVKELMNPHYKKIVLVATAQLRPYYETAIEMLNPETLPEIDDADKALIRGQFEILKRVQ
jgi:2-dehydro-3-deoxygalactonokinase